MKDFTVDPRLGDVLNYISILLPKASPLHKNEYLYLYRHGVENMCAREIILRETSKVIGRPYP